MEKTQENSLCSYLYLKQAKMSCFLFYLLCFFFCKIGEQEDGTCSAQGEVGECGWFWWEGEGGRERGKR
jgi:hypothetical protein